MFQKFVSILLTISFIVFVIPTASAKTFDAKVITNPYKSWTITFSDKIAYKNAQDLPIYIMTEDGEQHPISIILSDNSTKVIVQPTEMYTFGTNYTLVISKEMRSSSGKYLSNNVSMDFQLQSTSIKSVQATLNSFVTNVVVQSNGQVASMKVAVGNYEKLSMHKRSNQFEYGLIGLSEGDRLTFYAYNAQGSLIETTTYVLE